MSIVHPCYKNQKLCMYVCMHVMRPFPFAGYCSGMVMAMMTKFSRIIRMVHPFVALKFGARVTIRVLSTRVQLRHWFNIGWPLLPEMRVHSQQWA